MIATDLTDSRVVVGDQSRFGIVLYVTESACSRRPFWRLTTQRLVAALLPPAASGS